MKKVYYIICCCVLALFTIEHIHASTDGVCFDECPIGAIWFEHAL